MPNIISTLVPVEHVRKFLPVVAPWLEKTISECYWWNWSLDEVLNGLVVGAYQLWACGSGEKQLFLVSQIVNDVQGLSVHVILGGGQLGDGAVAQIALVESWAKDVGASSVVVWGRLGWKKLLAPHGYKFETAMFRRTLLERMN